MSETFGSSADPQKRYDLRLASAARRALTDGLSPSAAFAAWEFVDGPLRDAPRRVGKPLGPPFEGSWSARRGTYRIRYCVDEEAHVVNVIDIAGRADVYYPGRA